MAVLAMVLSCRTMDVAQQYATKFQANDQAKAETQSLGSGTTTSLSLPTATPPASVPARPSVVGPTPLAAGLRPEDRPTYTPAAVALLSGNGAAPPSVPPQPAQPAQPAAVQPGASQFVAPTLQAIPSQPPVARVPARAPAKSPTPTKIPPTPTPSYQYKVSFSWCGPNWLTFVEGTVTQSQTANNGLSVRIALDPDGSAIVKDYKVGTDPTKPGGYTQIIDANAPHGGLWYLWVVDSQTNKRISDIAIVKTDAKRIDEVSCQSANVNFSN